MNRRRFMAGAAMLPAAVRGLAQTAATDPLPGPHGQAQASPMKARYRLTLDRVMHGQGPAYTPDFLVEDISATPGRRFTEFSGDVSGRWIGALSVASAVYGEHFPVLDEVVRRVLLQQHPEGYFGKTFHFDRPDDNDLALLWGNGRLLVGLLEYYELKQDPAVLASAKRLGDFLLRIGPAFNAQAMADAFGAAHFASSYICWTQQTEGLAKLYAATKDARYRDLCAAIAARMERRPADHVHGYLCSLRGTVDLYRATGDATHLRRVEAAWRDVMQSGDVLLTGGVPEAWTPKKMRTEGCAEADWLRLNLALWDVTGNTAYLDMAERVLFNEFAMNQFSTGDFGHAMLNERGVPQTVYVRAWWCCTLHGLRAFPDVHRSAFRREGTRIAYVLPIDASIQSETFAAASTSTLATDGTIRIQIRRVARGATLTVRKPVWAASVAVTVNGHAVYGEELSGLKAGDVVSARYGMKLAQETGAGASHTALAYGPWLLGVSSQVEPEYFNELHASNHLMMASAKPSNEAHGNSPFAVAIAATSIGYIPAEFPEQPSRVQLRAIAEQTGYRPAQWEMVFVLKDKG